MTPKLALRHRHPSLGLDRVAHDAQTVAHGLRCERNAHRATKAVDGAEVVLTDEVCHSASHVGKRLSRLCPTAHHASRHRWQEPQQVVATPISELQLETRRPVLRSCLVAVDVQALYAQPM